MSLTTQVEELTIEQVREIFLRGDFSRLLHTEVQTILAVKEQEYIFEEIQHLTNKNLNQFHGSPHGFYYDGELFSTGAAFGRNDITVIHESLEGEAAALKANRIDIVQYITYLAHFLAFLGYITDDPVVYVANVPRGLARFSPSLQTLENWALQYEGPRLEKSAYNREDETKRVFFLHFDRINEPLQRFLFRRITK